MRAGRKDRRVAAAGAAGAEGAGHAAPETSALLVQQRSSTRKKCAVIGAILVVVALASLPIGVNDHVLHSPAEVVSAFQTFFWLVAQLFQGHTYNATQVMQLSPAFYQVLGRLGATFVCILCGIMTALAGSLYQMVFRNPIAAPTMLGVNSGVSLGVIFLVIAYGSGAMYLTGQRYLLCYIGAIAILAIVVALTLALGHGKLVPVDMLLIGSVVSSLVGQFVIYYSYCFFDTETWSLFNDLNEMLNINLEPLSYLCLIGAFCVSVTPVALMSFRMNLVAMDPDETRLLGVDPSRLRLVALVCGTIMIISAQVHVGTVAIVALVVPFVSRSVFGVEFKKQLVGDLLLGALVVLVSADLMALVRILLFQNGIVLDVPLGAIANVAVIPIFVWALAAKQGELQGEMR